MDLESAANRYFVPGILVCAATFDCSCHGSCGVAVLELRKTEYKWQSGLLRSGFFEPRFFRVHRRYVDRGRCDDSVCSNASASSRSMEGNDNQCSARVPVSGIIRVWIPDVSGRIRAMEFCTGSDHSSTSPGVLAPELGRTAAAWCCRNHLSVSQDSPANAFTVFCSLLLFDFFYSTHVGRLFRCQPEAGPFVTCHFAFVGRRIYRSLHDVVCRK